MKPGTFTQLYIQIVFAVKHRQTTLYSEIRPRIFKYMSGIITQLGHKSIIVNGYSDHVHIFLGLNPKQSISDLVRDVKRISSLFINTEKLCPNKFNWQEGYGAFSYHQSDIDRIYKYIENQEKKHQKVSFKKEYIKILNDNNIEFKTLYLFDFKDI